MAEFTAVWPLMILFVLTFTVVSSIDDKCAACNCGRDRVWPFQYKQDSSSYCGRLLEETEDELAELIKKGSVKVGGLSKILCQDLSKHCKQSSDSREVDADDDEPDGEL